MLDLLHVRKLLDGLIVEASKGIHDLVFLAAGLNADDDLVAPLPRPSRISESCPPGSWKSATISMTQSPVTCSMP